MWQPDSAPAGSQNNLIMKSLAGLADTLERHLKTNILPFWMERMQDGHGGFHGRISGDGTVDDVAPRGSVLYSRILWTFSAAYRAFGNLEYLECADRAKKWILEHFYDSEYGGVYWSVSPDGVPLDTKKQTYAQGFAIYGLSEYHRATGDAEALDYAVKLFKSIERNMYDSVNGGYVEAAARDWSALPDMRLSGKDENAPKTMNTHLHILEPYTALYRVWPDPKLRRRITGLMKIFFRRMELPKIHHLGLFFDERWCLTSPAVYSYGHEIEASWLLLEAAVTLGDEELSGRVRPKCRKIALAALQGYQPDGSMIYERKADGSLDLERHWWVQAECMVGLLWLYARHGMKECLALMNMTWDYISANLVDRKDGEWFWSILPDGTPNRTDDKAGFWKCPYHNARMCLELVQYVREK